MNNANNTHATSSAATVTCWKCLGKRYFERFGHIANGKCFACAGTGLCDVTVWSKGVVRDTYGVSFSFGPHAGSLLLSSDCPPVGGIIEMPRAFALECIKTNLDGIKDGHPEVITTAALRLAALGDERAVSRAITYVGGELGDKLASAMDGAREAITVAREMAR